MDPWDCGRGCCTELCRQKHREGGSSPSSSKGPAQKEPGNRKQFQAHHCVRDPAEEGLGVRGHDGYCPGSSGDS
jgi:hypothetical protein